MRAIAMSLGENMTGEAAEKPQVVICFIPLHRLNSSLRIRHVVHILFLFHSFKLLFLSSSSLGIQLCLETKLFM